MTDAELLIEVKFRLGLTGDYHDEQISAYIRDVKEYLIGAGVDKLVVDSSASVGVISRGVADTWNYGSGEGKFSELFYQRAIQLCYKKGEVNE